MTLAVKIGSQVGAGSIPAGLPGGAGTSGGPPAPNVGAGWEIRVLAAPDFHTVLALIPAKMVMSLQFAKQLKDLGSGTVTLDMDDPYWTTVTLPNGQPAHYLLDWEHVWQISQDGVVRFEFLGETITEQLADASEQRVATVTGPGTIATLKWAMAAPPGFPGAIRYKLDAISDSFSETDVNGNLVLDTGLWNSSAPTSHITLNPSGTAQLMASPGSTILGTTAYDATNTLVSAQVNPIVSPDAKGNNLDGSELTQMYVQSQANSAYYAMIALSATTFYCQFGGPSGVFTKTISSAAQYATAMSTNQNYQYWQISESLGDGGPHGWGTFDFWTSPDGQNWTRQWTIRHNWDATDVGLYFASKYDTDNAEFAAITGINSNVTTSSLGGPQYHGEPIIGGVWLDLLAQAQARGTIPFITTGQLSASTDSFGNPWTDTQSVQIANGTDLFTLLGAHASMINADWVMQPGFRLQVGIPETGKITLGTDRSKTVIFRDGMDCAARVRTRARDAIANLYGVINTDGRTVTADDTTSISEYGQREAWLQAGEQITTADLEAVASAADLQTATEVLSWTLQVSPWEAGRDIFNSYDVGDWVGLERPDFSAVDAVRVVAIAVQVAVDGSETHELTLNSYIQWLDQQLTYIQNKLGGNLINVTGTTAIPNSITNQNTPTVFSLTLGSLGDVNAGANGNAPLVYDPVTGQWVPAGSANGISTGPVPVAIAGPNGTVTVAGDGSGVTVAGPTSVPPDAGIPGPVAKVTTTPTGTVVTDGSGVTRIITGLQGDGTITITESGGTAPNAPDAPIATGVLGGISVAWDGLLAGAAPLSDFQLVQVHVSTTSGFTPGSGTLMGTLATAGTYLVGGLSASTTYYAKLVALNRSNVASAASAQASAMPTGVSASAIGNIGVLNNNPYFSGGDGTGWAGVSGTFAVTASPPSGSPYGHAGQFSITTAGVGAAAKESGDPFPVVGSTPYLATAWAYTATTSVVLGFDFFTGPNGTGSLIAGTYTQTTTVTANTWTSVTSVITAPSNAVSAFLRIAPADGSGNSIYFEAILALPQVPGGLIQAGTVTATQIAAATITAANIAANTITAGQIAANTITAAQIAAATITASQIAAATITGTQIAAATITASNIAAGTITATQIATGTITASLLAANIVVAGIVDATTIKALQYIASGSTGQFLAYSGTPASGNLLNAISGATGTDGFGNSWPQGLLSQQLTLQNQASAPAAFSGASVFFSSSAGRPRYISQTGADSIIDRSEINVATFSMNTQTIAQPMSATLSYSAGEGLQSSEFDIDIDGTITAPTSGSALTYTFALYLDGSSFGGQFTLGAVFLVLNATFAFSIRYRCAILGSGTGGTAFISADGVVQNQSGNVGNSNVSFPVCANSGGTTKSIDTTVAHTFQVKGAWASGTASGHSAATYRTTLGRRD